MTRAACGCWWRTLEPATGLDEAWSPCARWLKYNGPFPEDPLELLAEIRQLVWAQHYRP